MGQSLSLLSSYFSFRFSKILFFPPLSEKLIPTKETCLAFHILVPVMGFNHLCRCLTIYVEVQEPNIKSSLCISAVLLPGAMNMSC